MPDSDKVDPQAPVFGKVVLGKIIIGVSIIAAAALLGRAFTRYVDAKFRDGIKVSGSATERVTSDRAIWSGTLHARGSTLVEAYQTLHAGIPRAKKFLLQKGIKKDEIVVGSISTDEFYARNADGMRLEEEIIGYELTQSISVTSANVALVGKVSQDITELIEEGMHIVSRSPEYIFTGLKKVKHRLVGNATADARERATRVSKNSASSLGELISVRVGVIQVNAANETEVSWEGMNDRSSVEKDVMVVVHTMFLID